MHKTKNNKLFRLWRYKIKKTIIQCMYIEWCLIKSYKLHPALIECSISELRRFGCRVFNIRRTAVRMSKIRHSKKGASDVEYSTFDKQLIECRKSDIWRRALRMSNIRHSKDCCSNVKNPTFQEGCFGCRIFDIRLCGRSNRKNPIQQIRRIESNLRHSIRQNAHI